MSTRRLLAAIPLLILPPPVAIAQAVPGPVVSVDWLTAHIEDPDLVLIHVGRDANYAEGHLPGARLLREGMMQAPRREGSVLDMPSAEQLGRDLATFGITDRSRIVVVFNDEWVTPATRVLLTLRYAGLGDRSALLDGGQAAWVRAGRSLTTAVPADGGGNATVRLDPSILVEAEQVRAFAREGSDTRIVDARAPVYYNGPSHGEHPAGHIPTAVNIPFTSVVGDDLLLLSQEELRARFTAAGIRPGEALVVYCHIGQQASLVYLAARLLGHPVRFFDGSFDDWARRKLPVEGGTPSE